MYSVQLDCMVRFYEFQWKTQTYTGDLKPLNGLYVYNIPLGTPEELTVAKTIHADKNHSEPWL